MMLFVPEPTSSSGRQKLVVTGKCYCVNRCLTEIERVGPLQDCLLLSSLPLILNSRQVPSWYPTAKLTSLRPWSCHAGAEWVELQERPRIDSLRKVRGV